MAAETQASWNISRRVDGSSAREVIWSGPRNRAPDVLTLSQVITSTWNEDQIADLTVHILQNGSVSALASLLSVLSCAFCRESVPGSDGSTQIIDVRMFKRLRDGVKKSTCGRIFKKGDIIWQCRSCGKDTACVQCDPCFRNSNHQGHEVYFYRSSGGAGCCDCGDSEAWAKQGNCCDHSPPGSDEGEEVDPSSTIPENFRRGFRAVVEGILTFVTTHTCCVMRGYVDVSANPFISLLQEQLPSDQIVLSLHNDDIHTYEDVTRALHTLGFSNTDSREMTARVDREGATIVLNDLASSPRLNEFHTHLNSAVGLLTSVLPHRIHKQDRNVVAGLKWLCEKGEESDGLRRIIATEYNRPIGSAASHQLSIILDDPAYEAFNLHAMCVGENARHFPQELPKLNEIELLSIHPSASISSAVDRDPEYEVKTRIRFPLSTQLDPFAEGYFVQCPLSLNLLASPFLSQGQQNCLYDIMMRFQYDSLYKASFSQCITVLYPSLMALYMQHVGTKGDSIFRNTVQVYTANTVIESMSYPTSIPRPLAEAKGMIKITNMLAIMLLVTLKQSGGEASRPGHLFNSEQFLNHHNLRNRRMSQICRDWEYICATPAYCARLLCGQVNDGSLTLWVDVCKFLQLLDSTQRHILTHVERESDAWQSSMNLAIDIESASTHLIATGLLHKTAHDHEDQVIIASGLSLSEYRQQAFNVAAHDIANSLMAWVRRFMGVCPVETISPLGGDEVRIVQYTVSTQPVSIHIPLHHLLAKTIMFAANGGLKLHLFFQQSSEAHNVEWIMEHPLHALVFAAQVRANMWRRNGYSVANVALNYASPTLGRYFRNYDLIIVQMVLRCHNVQYTLPAIIGRFELVPAFQAACEGQNYLENTTNTWDESTMLMLNEFAQFIIHLFTYLPTKLLDQVEGSMSSEADRLIHVMRSGSAKAVLIREIFHNVLCSTQTSVGQLGVMKSLVGFHKTVTDNMLSDAVDLIATQSNDSASFAAEGPKITLKEHSYQLFDPEFMNLPPAQGIKAFDRMKEKLRQVKEELYLRPQTAPGNSYKPLFYPLAVPTIHEDFLSVRNLMYSPVFTKMLLCLSRWACMPTYIARSSLMGRVIHLITLQLHCRANCNQDSYFDNFALVSDDQAALVKQLGQMWQDPLIANEEIYRQALGFVLHEIAARCRDSREYLASQVNFQVNLDDNLSSLQQTGKKATGKGAQQKALDMMKNMASAFAAEMMHDDDSDEDENDANATPLCIICKERNEHAVGLLTFAQPSNYVKNLVCKGSVEFSALQDVYRVVALEGCSVRSSYSIKSPVISTLEYNQHVVVSERRDRNLVRITAPIEGWCEMYVSLSPQKQPTNGVFLISKYAAQVKTILTPVTSLMFNRHGPSRLHISTCGHAMHFGCFDDFFSATYSRHVNQFSNDHHWIDVNKGEFLCPLCKGIGNGILCHNAHNDHSKAEASSDSKVVDLSNYDAFKAQVTTTVMLNADGDDGDESITEQSKAHDRRFLGSLLAQLHSFAVHDYCEETIHTKDLFAYRSMDELLQGDMRGLRCLGVGVHAAAYTMAVCAYKGLAGYENSGNVEQEMLLSRMLMSLLRRSRGLFSTEQGYHKQVLQPLLSSLFGRNDERPKSSWHHLLSMFPFQPVSALLYPEDIALLVATSLARQDGAYAEYITSPWHFLAAPLLEQELSLSVTLAAAVIDDQHVFQSMVTTMVLAKIAQVLVSPTATGLVEMMRFTEAAMDVVNDDIEQEIPLLLSLGNLLENHRATLCNSASIPALFNKAPQGTALTIRVLESLVPYLEMLRIISSARMGQVISVDQSLVVSTASPVELFTYAEQVLSVMTGQFHSLPQLLSMSSVEPFLTAWATEMKCYRQPDHVHTAMEVAANDEAALLPQYRPLPHSTISQAMPSSYALMGEELQRQLSDMSTMSDASDNLFVPQVQEGGAENDPPGPMGVPEMFNMPPAGLQDVLNRVSELMARIAAAEQTQQGAVGPAQLATAGELAPVEGGGAVDNDAMAVDDATAGQVPPIANAPPAVAPPLPTGITVEPTAGGAVNININLNDIPTDIGALLALLGEQGGFLGGLPGAGGLPPMMGDEEGDLFNPMFDGGVDATAPAAADRRTPTVVGWDCFGVDPFNPWFDEIMNTEFQAGNQFYHHMRLALQANVTGSMTIFSLAGQELSLIFPDLSHMDVTLTALRKPYFPREKFPMLYTDLYNMVKFPVRLSDGESIEEPAICLTCGTVLSAGKGAQAAGVRSMPGECTMHNMICGGGTGVYFLTQAKQCMLMRGGRAIFFPSIYVDATGDSGGGGRGGHESRPLFVQPARLQRVEELCAGHAVGREVTRRRSTERSILRTNWF